MTHRPRIAPCGGIFLSLALLLGSAVAHAQSSTENPSLNPRLEPLRPLLGKTWKGAFKNSKPDQPTVDILRCERALNGQAARFLHSINQGAYGGETLFIVDPKTQKVVYYYFTTAGFMTTGSVEFDGSKMISREKIEGSASGITEVRAESVILPDGKFHVKSEYFKEGKWVPGHEVTYAPDPTAEVVFK